MTADQAFEPSPKPAPARPSFAGCACIPEMMCTAHLLQLERAQRATPCGGACPSLALERRENAGLRARLHAMGERIP